MMVLRKRFPGIRLIVLLLTTLMMISACGGGSEPTATPLPPTATPVPPTATAAPTPTEEPTRPPTATPATSDSSGEVDSSQATSPLAAPESPLAAPLSPLATPPAAATPVTSADGGGLTGQIIVTGPSGDIPVAGLVIGLAEVIKGEDGLPKASGYEASAAPKATTDDFGRFVFDNLKPSLYTLILDAVITQYQLDNVETGDTILVEIKPNETVALGELRYPSLPIPGFQ